MRRGHDTQRGLDRRDGTGVRIRVVEGGLVAERRLRLGDPLGHGMGVRPVADEAGVLELLAVGERILTVELGEPRLEAVPEPAEGDRIEEGIERLDVRVDREHLDAVRPEEPGEHRDREIRRGRVARGRVDECDAHARRIAHTR